MAEIVLDLFCFFISFSHLFSIIVAKQHPCVFIFHIVIESHILIKI